jgi:hypothetical protein
VAHLTRSSSRISVALYANEFVVAPKRSVEEKKIRGFEFLQQRVVNLWHGGHVGQPVASGRIYQQA